MFVLIRNIEILHHSRPMVRTDEILDYFRQLMLFRQLNTIGDMTDDNLCTLLVTQTFMWIDARLVFGEESRIHHLANVVIQGTGTHQLTIGTDAVSSFSS